LFSFLRKRNHTFEVSLPPVLLGCFFFKWGGVSFEIDKGFGESVSLSSFDDCLEITGEDDSVP